MIKDTLDQLFRYKEIIPGWDLISENINLKRLQELDEGEYRLEDGKSFFIIAKYSTKKFQETQFEIHRKFIDIQIVLEGVELIYTAPVSRLIADLQGYDEKNDIQFGKTTVPDVLLLKEADFAVFYPEDAHNPGCSVGTHALAVKKAIFKIGV